MQADILKKILPQKFFYDNILKILKNFLFNGKGRVYWSFLFPD